MEDIPEDSIFQKATFGIWNDMREGIAAIDDQNATSIVWSLDGVLKGAERWSWNESETRVLGSWGTQDLDRPPKEDQVPDPTQGNAEYPEPKDRPHLPFTRKAEWNWYSSKITSSKQSLIDPKLNIGSVKISRVSSNSTWNSKNTKLKTKENRKIPYFESILSKDVIPNLMLHVPIDQITLKNEVKFQNLDLNLYENLTFWNGKA